MDASADGRSGTFVVARNEEEAYSKAREEHGEHVVLNRESDVLDTWFSSGLWPFSTLGKPQGKRTPVKPSARVSAACLLNGMMFKCCACTMLCCAMLCCSVLCCTVAWCGVV